MTKSDTCFPILSEQETKKYTNKSFGERHKIMQDRAKRQQEACKRKK